MARWGRLVAAAVLLALVSILAVSGPAVSGLAVSGPATATAAGYAGPGALVRIVSPARNSQIPAAGAFTVVVKAKAPADPSHLVLTLLSGYPARPPVDLTGRLVVSGDQATASVVRSDLVAGPAQLIAQSTTTSAHAITELSWEPAIDTSRAGQCDFLGQSRCMLPFPNDWFTARDGTTATGRRVAFGPTATPANSSGVHIDPTEWNRNDGFSPGSLIMAQIPGLDLRMTGAAPITQIARSLEPGTPIVLVDTSTGEHWPQFAELDANAATPSDQALLIRPGRNLTEGHRYIVALRGLKNSTGGTIAPSRGFQVYRDQIPTFDPVIEGRRRHMERLFSALTAAGVARSDLTLAWDFTVASATGLAGPLLHIRDDAFGSLKGAAPKFSVTSVQDNVDSSIFRRVTGTFRVPRYLTGTGAPGSRFNRGPDGLPARNGSYNANFICIIPRSATAAGGDPVTPGRPVVYGHGLLGGAQEVNSFGAIANQADIVFCATDWIGMSAADVANVLSILQDESRFPTLADRVDQGILNFQFLARLLKDPRGFAANAAFQAGAAHTPVFTTGEVFFNGNSQGGILGGAATAVSTEWTRAVLGVPGMNFSTLITRSVDFAPFAGTIDAAYPSALDRELGYSIIQMLWDRSEGDGYAEHVTTNPYPGTPVHQVLMIEAFGDHQVANITTETEARTNGVAVYQPALAPGRSTDVTPMWGIPAVPSFPYAGSALVIWDYGTPAPPTTDLPPSGPQYGNDPHGLGAHNPGVAAEASAFLEPSGVFIDVCGGKPCQDLSAATNQTTTQ